MELSLMRHGQTDWNLKGLVQGRTDIPLNATGRQQARDAARQFTEHGHDWDVVVSSTLLRAHETAQIVAEVLGLPFEGGRDLLIEQNYGDAEGTPVGEISERWPMRDFPGGETDESLGQRGIDAIDDVAREFSSQRVLAVSHGAFIRRLISVAVGAAYSDVPRIPNVSVSRLQRDPHAWSVLTVGGTPVDEAIATSA